jgi:hypothetical protein
MRGTQSHQTAVISEPVLHAFTAERGAYEESTFWNPSWTLAKGSVMITRHLRPGHLGTGHRQRRAGLEEVPQGAGRSFARRPWGTDSQVPQERLLKANAQLPLRHRHLHSRGVDTAEPVVQRLGRPASVPTREGPDDRRLGDAREGRQSGAQRWPDGLRRDRRRACTWPPAQSLTETTLFTRVRGGGILRGSLPPRSKSLKNSRA